MGRKLFWEKGITANGTVLPLEKFVPFTDRGSSGPRGLSIRPEYAEELIRSGEKLLGKKYPSLLASEYMRFKEDGNRTCFEDIYFERRTDLIALTAAELSEGKGRFLKQIIDLAWLICDEATWVLPAHNLSRPGDNGALPYCIDAEYADAVDYIDLFAASTGADLAVVQYFLGDRLDAVSPCVRARLKAETDRRILRPFTDRRNHRRMFWLGKYGPVNNWCPWVISNVLTVAALTEPELQVREDIVGISLEALDVFTSVYSEEGSCDEGPGYWTVAAGAYFNALEVLYDMTGGKINVYSDPLVRNLFGFISRLNISEKYNFCYADSPVSVELRFPWIYEMGQRTGSEQLSGFARFLLKGPVMCLTDDRKIYSSLHQLAVPKDELAGGDDYRAPLCDYMPDLKIAVSRESAVPGKGFCLTFKGGSNGEGHNHNDVGEVTVFLDGEPVFIDVGSGSYTRRTFSPKRYEIWSLCSGFHNTATVNGQMQPPGPGSRSSGERWDPETGELSMELRYAYPGSAGLSGYVKSARIENGRVLIREQPGLLREGTVEYNYMCRELPLNPAPGRVRVGKAEMDFSPELECVIEQVPADEPETEKIPGNWDAENIYRIRLIRRGLTGRADDVFTVRRAED